MAWANNNSETLGAKSDNMDLTLTRTNVFHHTLTYWWSDNVGGVLGDTRFDNDSGTKYAWREQVNGNADTTSSSDTEIDTNGASSIVGGDNEIFYVGFICNVVGEEVLAIYHGFRDSTNATIVPDRFETVAKFTDTTAITSINMFENGATGQFDTGSSITAMGTD